MIVTKSFDDALFKVVPIEATNESYIAACQAYMDWSTVGGESSFTHNDVYRSMLAAVADDLPGVVTHSGDPVADHDPLAIIAATIESAAKKCIDVAGGDSGVVDNASHGWGCGDCAKAIAALDPSTILAGIK